MCCMEELEIRSGKHVDVNVIYASVELLINYDHDKFPYNTLPFPDIFYFYTIFGHENKM